VRYAPGSWSCCEPARRSAGRRGTLLGAGQTRCCEPARRAVRQGPGRLCWGCSAGEDLGGSAGAALPATTGSRREEAKGEQ
jgi:hypothetical protein